MKSHNLIKNLKELQKLESAGQPRESWVVSNKQMLMQQVRVDQANGPAEVEALYYWQYFKNMLTSRALMPVASFAIMAIMIFGFSATWSLAGSSLPGDILYPIKTTSERVQMVLAFSDDQKVQLQMDFISRRTEELSQLVNKTDEGSAQRVSQVVAKINHDVKEVQDRFNKIQIAAGPDAIEVAKDVDSKSLKLAQSLNEVNRQLNSKPQVKTEAGSDLKVAIVYNQETGDRALNMIIEQYGRSEIESVGSEDEAEVIVRIEERIKAIENSINGSQVASTSPAEVSISTITPLNSTTTLNMEVVTTTDQYVGTTTIDTMVQDILNVVDEDVSVEAGEIRELLTEARDFLDQKAFVLALDKIKVAQGLLDKLRNGQDENPEVKGVTDNSNINNNDENSNINSNDDEVVNFKLKVETGESSATSESTDSLIK